MIGATPICLNYILATCKIQYTHTMKADDVKMKLIAAANSVR